MATYIVRSVERRRKGEREVQPEQGKPPSWHRTNTTLPARQGPWISLLEEDPGRTWNLSGGRQWDEFIGHSVLSHLLFCGILLSHGQGDPRGWRPL